MFRTTTTYKVHPKTLLDKIFTNGLPVNSFIDKGRCAIGATYGEIMNKLRCTIITVPNISILLNKKEAHPELDIVYGDVSYDQVQEMLKQRKAGHKIMTTPEGMRKIMKAAEETGRLKEFYTSWFLLLDEAHTFISENYREDILVVFNYFWDFTYKSIISATPYVFTDKRFEQLHHHKIEFTETIGVVSLIECKSIEGTLNYLLTHLDLFPGNVHIFYNSVTEIYKVIKRAGLLKCNIFCADDKLHKNFAKLGELVKFFKLEPKSGEYEKVNFYTSKYFEGWDLYDQSATVMLVTDFRREHTKIGIQSKGKQAIGRLRNAAHQIIHLTNHANVKEMKPLEHFRNEYLVEAQLFIEQNEEYRLLHKDLNTKFKLDSRLTKYADIEKLTNKATLNLMKLDQQINEAANNEIYNHIDFIKKDWEEGYIQVESDYSDLTLDATTTIARKSASKQLEEDYKRLKEHKDRQRESNVFNIGQNLEQTIKASNPLAFQAFESLTLEKMNELKFNIKKVKAELIINENSSVEVKLLKLLANVFQVNSTYSNEFIKDKLQEFYTLLNIRDMDGKIKTAIANQISDKGRFETRDTKRKGPDGKPEHVKLILRAQFGLRMAA